MKVEESLKALSVRDDVKKLERDYRRKKKQRSFMLILAGIFLSILFFWQAEKEDTSEDILTRPEAGEGSKECELPLIVENGEEEMTTVVSVEVNEVRLTREELDKELETNLEQVRKSMLGKNESTDRITEKLNLISTVGKYGTEVRWQLPEDEIIDFDGEVHAQAVGSDGKVETLIVQLKLQNVEKSYEIPIKIMPLSWEKKLAEDLQQKVNEKEYDKEVSLPEQINGRKIKLQQEKNYNYLLFIVLGVLAAVINYRNTDQKLFKKTEERNFQLQADYPDIVSHLVLYMQAGLSVKQSFERMTVEYEEKKEKRYAYEEIKLMLNKIDSGVSQEESFYQFGRRCSLKSYLKLGNLLAQSIKKGNQEMAVLLQEEVMNGMEEKKALMLRKGEEVTTKLLLPMVMMLFVVIIVIVVPAFLQMQL